MCARLMNGKMIDKLCIVIVTYKRQELLGRLLDSILNSTQAPWRVVLVDNENSPDTEKMVCEFNTRAADVWGAAHKVETKSAQAVEKSTTATTTSCNSRNNFMIYAPQSENLGGSGGFSEGVRIAYKMGAQWFWLMDDDVAILPDALDKMEPWTKKFDVLQGRKYDYDGGAFFWQNDFRARMGMHNPLSSEKFNEDGYLVMNNMCFEGGMIKRNIVEKIGLPDPRFFIYWDDAVYGYLAHRVTTCALVNVFILQRTREIKNKEIGRVRQLNSTSDTNRYYIMRNRGHIANYLRDAGDYNPLVFGVGSALEISKETARLLLVDRGHIKSGFRCLASGWRDARKIMKDKNWKPMSQLK